MPLHCAPSQNRRAPVVLQPYYYTSAVFVEPTNDDISRLLSAFENTCKSSSEQPFQLFKSIWVQQGWDLIHVKVLEPRGREVFLATMTRLFLDNVLCDETLLWRLGALFGLYTFHCSQPSGSTPQILVQHEMTVAIDEYRALIDFPASLTGSLKRYAMHIISHLMAMNAFYIIPPSSLSPHNPRALPHSRLAIHSAEPSSSGKRKRGRLSKLEKNKKAEKTLAALTNVVEVMGKSRAELAGNQTEQPALVEAYIHSKEKVVDTTKEEIIMKAAKKTIDRMRLLDKKALAETGERGLLKRAEEAVKEPSGLLRLVVDNQDLPK